jgi:hypothetical protein
MKMSRLTVSKESGTTPEAIANHILKKKDCGDIPKEYRARLENRVINANSKSYYELRLFQNFSFWGDRLCLSSFLRLNDDISVPDDSETIKITLVRLLDNSGDERPEVPGPLEAEGWTLTEDGHLVKGKTGFLIDENKYYILQDGRRVNNENALYNGEDLRIGAKEPEAGFRIIMEGSDLVKSSSPLSIKDSYEVYGELLKEHGTALKNLVVYQAFQINRGHKLKEQTVVNSLGTNTNWQSCGKGAVSDAVFGVIGLDETRIPIVVTRIGQGNAGKKLVTAGPHGDERNAQRVIMKTQECFSPY